MARAGAVLSTIEALAPRRSQRDEGLVTIETCTSRWTFDERLHLFARSPVGAPDGEPEQWDRYERLLVTPRFDAFVVFLDSSGTRLLRSRRHRASCPRCAALATQSRSREEPRRVVRGPATPP